MRKPATKSTQAEGYFTAAWSLCAVTGLALLLIDYWVLPTFLDTPVTKTLLLPIIQTILLYGALFLGIVAFVIAVNARFFSNDIKQTEQQHLNQEESLKSSESNK